MLYGIINGPGESCHLNQRTKPMTIDIHSWSRFGASQQMLMR
jgi:hypothetical protein